MASHLLCVCIGSNQVKARSQLQVHVGDQRMTTDNPAVTVDSVSLHEMLKEKPLNYAAPPLFGHTWVIFQF